MIDIVADMEQTLALARFILFLTPFLFVGGIGIWWYVFKVLSKRKEDQ